MTAPGTITEERLIALAGARVVAQVPSPTLPTISKETGAENVNRSLAYLWIGILWAAMFVMIHVNSYKNWSAPIRHQRAEDSDLSRFRLLAENSFKGGYLP